MATPPASPAPVPGAPKPPAARPGAPAPVAPPAPRSGDVTDQGAVVRDSVRARSWTLRGYGKVPGPVELDLLTLQGTLAVGGTARIDRCDSRGHLTVAGAAQGSGPWTVDGEHRFGGALAVQSLRGSGRVDVRGDLAVTQELQLAGTLDVAGEVAAGSVAITGALAVTGELRAAAVEIHLRSASKLANLRADRVVVDRPVGRPGKKGPTLELLEIEAKEVALTGVTAQYVRADRIRLGPDCHLARVDGSVVAQDRKSHVGPERLTHIPDGLTLRR